MYQFPKPRHGNRHNIFSYDISFLLTTDSQLPTADSHNKCYTFRQIIVFTTEKLNINKSLQTLGFLTLHTPQKMLHWCNIFKENRSKIYR